MGRALINSRILVTLALCAAGAVLFVVMGGGAPQQQSAEAAFPGANGKIAFISNLDGDIEIYTINADGSGLTQLTFGDSNSGPAWSPDGTKIAFVHLDFTTVARDIYTMNADGSAQTNITNNGAGVLYGEPAWSPDGAKIAFTWDNDIWVINADGTGLANLTNSFGGNGEKSAAWSPDGSEIAYLRAGLYKMNADGTGQTKILSGGVVVKPPNWSPDGMLIVFQDDLTDNIHVVNADGTGPINLTNGAGVERSPAWSPDGTKIVYYGDGGELFTMDANGTGAVQLTDIGYADQPDWQPIADFPNSNIDLVVKSMKIEIETGSACNFTSTNLGVTVVFSNVSIEDAGAFSVEVNGVQQAVPGGLNAGGQQSLWFKGYENGSNVATVDVLGQIDESNESNNTLSTPLGVPTLPPTCTPTITPTVTPTPTPKDPNADTDGDTIPNGSDPDDDNDGCTDVQENGSDQTLGGLRNPHNPWDFYDVAIAGGVQGQDKQVDLFNDIVGVIDHYGPTGLEPEYDAWYDRGPTAGPNSWNMTAPDGKIDLFNDIVGVINQFGHDCR